MVVHCQRPQHLGFCEWQTSPLTLSVVEDISLALVYFLVALEWTSKVNMQLGPYGTVVISHGCIGACGEASLVCWQGMRPDFEYQCLYVANKQT